MKVLCLHGTGSNNEIFSLQTASLRSLLDDFVFEFVEGTNEHREGSWSRHYQSSSFNDTPLYTYFNLFDMRSMFEAEANLLEVMREEDPPFDGILAYSAGAALAAQAFLHYEREKGSLVAKRPLFKFAIFCNGVTPQSAFKLEGQHVQDYSSPDTTLKDECMQYIDLVSRLRTAGMPHMAEQNARNRAKDLEWLESMKMMTLKDGTSFLTDGTYGLAQFNPFRGEQISVPTLHIRDLAEPGLCGLGLLQLCEARLAKEYHHKYGHEFPRSYIEMKEIARLVREVAETA